ncbi:glycosyltransferase family 2 protein [Algibacter sp.]|nr:glycosyltransferase family 2 protein [Algibacter sp.]
MNDQLPLITFILFAYNQEEYIRAAVEGAFAQTYENLEIILSDDCSPDKTFEIMQEMASEYNGPHRIVLNTNENNLGIGAHVWKVGMMAHGKWIVMAAGDDISFPERVEKIVEFSNCSDGEVRLITSGHIDIGSGENYERHLARTYSKKESGDPFYLLKHEPIHHGATAAYDSMLFREFGPIKKGVVYEDKVLFFRCALIRGGVGQVSDYLLKIRSGGVASTDDRSVHLSRIISAFEQSYEDIKWLGREDDKLASYCLFRIRELKMIQHFFHHPFGVLNGLRQVLFSPKLLPRFVREVLRGVCRV